MVQFGIVPFKQVAEKIAELLPSHKDAVYGAAKLDWEQYFLASDAGQCLAVIAVKDEILVGYAVYVTGRNMNHRDIITADNTGFFVRPEYRGIGLKLLKVAHEALKKLGAHEINYILADKRVGKLLTRLKPSKTFTVYSFDE